MHYGIFENKKFFIVDENFTFRHYGMAFRMRHAGMFTKGVLIALKKHGIDANSPDFKRNFYVVKDLEDLKRHVLNNIEGIGLDAYVHECVQKEIMENVLRELKSLFFSTNMEEPCRYVSLVIMDGCKYPFIYFKMWDEDVRLGYYNTHRKECIWYGNGIGKLSWYLYHTNKKRPTT